MSKFDTELCINVSFLFCFGVLGVRMGVEAGLRPYKCREGYVQLLSEPAHYDPGKT